MDHLKVKNYLQRNGTDWTLWCKNPPGASHMGGMRKHQTPRCLGRIAKNTLLNDETLRTMTTEVKSIINSRPNSNGQIPFSPSKLLKMKANVVMPHLVSLQNQIYIPEEDGDMCSILQRSFDTDGEWSFCKVYRLDKNGMIKGEILTLVTL